MTTTVATLSRPVYARGGLVAAGAAVARVDLGRLAASLLVAVVIPGVVFYVALVASGITAAVLLALAWTYGAIVWRKVTNRPMSGLLALTVAIMTAKTIFTLADRRHLRLLLPAGGHRRRGRRRCSWGRWPRPGRWWPGWRRTSTRCTPRSRTARRIKRLFWRLTLMWSFVPAAKGVVTLWLLTSQSMVNFVLLKNVAMLLADRRRRGRHDRRAPSSSPAGRACWGQTCDVLTLVDELVDGRRARRLRSGPTRPRRRRRDDQATRPGRVLTQREPHAHGAPGRDRRTPAWSKLAW